MKPPPHPSHDDVKQAVHHALAPVLVELKWQRWVLFALIAVTVSPKVGGPSAPTLAAQLLGGVAKAATGS